MNTYTKTSALTLHVLLIPLLYILSISLSHAHDSDYQGQYGMGHMGMGHMGMGHMGMGHMGMGHMGMGHMGMGHMGMGHMGMGHMGMGHMGMGHMDMGHMDMSHMCMGLNYLHMLDLSDTQRKALRDIRKKSRTQHLALQEKIAEYADQLYPLYDQDKPDAQKISAVYQQIFDVKRKLIELRINTQNQKYDVLTKEQQEKMKEWKSGGIGSHRHNHEGGRSMHHMMR